MRSESTARSARTSGVTIQSFCFAQYSAARKLSTITGLYSSGRSTPGARSTIHASASSAIRSGLVMGGAFDRWPRMSVGHFHSEVGNLLVLIAIETDSHIHAMTEDVNNRRCRTLVSDHCLAPVVAPQACLRHQGACADAG